MVNIMQRFTLYIASAALVLSACGQSPGNDSSNNNAATAWAVFDAPPSGRANQGTIVAGEFVGTDEIHFARGANADGLDHEQYYAPGGVPPEPQPAPVEDDDVYRHSTWGAFGTDRAAHNGDYLLPTDLERWPDFTSDLAFFRMEADATDLYLQLRFVSFPAPETQIATVTITPLTATPAVTPWPRNAGIGSSYDMALTIWSTDAELASAGGAATTLSSLGGAVRITNHAFEVRVPLASLPAGPWKIGVGSGLADPADASQYWTVPQGAPTSTSPGTDTASQPGSNVWDLMFTPHDPLFHDDHIQANLLTTGDVSTATVAVQPFVLQARLTLPAPPITGRIAHTYESAFDFGDGIARGSMSTPVIPVAPATVKPRDPAVSYEYLGGVQPYFAYIPQDYPNTSHDWPLVLYMHGLNNYIWEPFGLTLGLEDELEARGYLFASLLGRGDIGFEGRGELDPLEVIAHMSARYRIDPQRIYLMGHSHGGGGQVSIAPRQPDLFAAIAPAQIISTLNNPENLLYMPSIHIAGLGDPIDNGPSAQARYDALSALGYDAQLLIYAAKTHENSSIYDALDEIFGIFDRTVRPENPATVIFTRSGGDFDEELGLLHDGAYWVANMVAINPAADMHITAESFAIAHAPLDPPSATRNNNQPVDTAGPSGRSLGNLSQTTPAFGPNVTVENRAEVTATNLAAVTLNVVRMGLSLGGGGGQIDVDLNAELLLTIAGLTVSNLAWRVEDAGGTELSSGNGLEISIPSAAARVVFP